MNKHDPEVALSNARELFSIIRHYNNDPKVGCMEQYMCNILAYLETESVVRASESGSENSTPNNERVQSLCEAIRNAISGYNSPSLIAELYSVLEKYERSGTKPVS